MLKKEKFESLKLDTWYSGTLKLNISWPGSDHLPQNKILTKFIVWSIEKIWGCKEKVCDMTSLICLYVKKNFIK